MVCNAMRAVVRRGWVVIIGQDWGWWPLSQSSLGKVRNIIVTSSGEAELGVTVVVG